MSYRLIVFGFACILFGYGCQPETDIWSPLEIRKLKEGEKPILADAVAGDVVVFESGTLEFVQYNFRYHHSYAGELKNYGAMYGVVGGFEKGFYRWKDDTTVVVKMVYPTGDSTQVFELFGNGSTSGISLPN